MELVFQMYLITTKWITWSIKIIPANMVLFEVKADVIFGFETFLLSKLKKVLSSFENIKSLQQMAQYTVNIQQMEANQKSFRLHFFSSGFILVHILIKLLIKNLSTNIYNAQVLTFKPLLVLSFPFNITKVFEKLQLTQNIQLIQKHVLKNKLHVYIKVSLKYNIYTIQFSYLKCIIQCFLVYSQDCTTINYFNLILGFTQFSKFTHVVACINISFF